MSFAIDMSRIKRLAKEGSWIVVGQIATVLGSLVLVRVLTEHLDPVQYGQLALGMTVAGLVNQVVMGGVGAAIARFYSIAQEKQDTDSYMRATNQLLAYATAAVMAIGAFLLVVLVWFGYSKWTGLASAALIFAVLSGYNSALSGIQNAARQRALVAIHSGLDAWLKIGLAMGVVLWLGASSSAVVIGYACSSFIITISQIHFLRRTISRQASQDNTHSRWLKQMWLYSIPFSTWGTFTWLQQVSDRWALQTFTTAAEVGQYAVLYQLGYTPIALISGLAMSFLGPILYQRSGDTTDHIRNGEVNRLSWRMMQVSLLVTVIGYICALFLHDWFFHILVARDYRNISYLLPWVVLAGGTFASGQVLSLKLMSEMKPTAMKMVKITTAIGGIFLNILGASYYGTDGVVIAVFIFSMSYLLWMIALVRRLSAL